MSEQITEAAPKELKDEFLAACFFLAAIGIRRIPLAHGRTADIEVGPDLMATYAVLEPVPTNRRQADVLRSDITLYANGLLEKYHELVYADEEAVDALAPLIDSSFRELFQHENDMSQVSATELRETVEFLQLVGAIVSDSLC